MFLSNTLNISHANDLGKYLGFPLNPFYKKNNYSFILAKIKNKLLSYKKKLL